MPERLAGFGVERGEIPVTNRAEHDAAGRGQHAVGERTLEDFEVPRRLPALRIDRLDAGRRRRIVRPARRRNAPSGAAADVLPAALVFGRPANVLRTAF